MSEMIVEPVEPQGSITMSLAAPLQSFARATPPFYLFNQPEGFRISIPVKSTWLISAPAFVFLSACCLAVLYGVDRLVRYEAMTTNGIPAVAAVLGMTVGCACIFYWWLWMVAGGETIAARDTTIAIKRDILGIGRTTEFDLLFVRDLRVELLPPTPQTHLNMINWRGGGGCCVTFDYRGVPHYFGIGLFEDEAQALVHAIQRRVSVPSNPARRRRLDAVE
jgi:hypothetical protein